MDWRTARHLGAGSGESYDGTRREARLPELTGGQLQAFIAVGLAQTTSPAARSLRFRVAVHRPSARPSTFMHPPAESSSIQPASFAVSVPASHTKPARAALYSCVAVKGLWRSTRGSRGGKESLPPDPAQRAGEGVNDLPVPTKLPAVPVGQGNPLGGGLRNSRVLDIFLALGRGSPRA